MKSKEQRRANHTQYMRERYAKDPEHKAKVLARNRKNKARDKQKRLSILAEFRKNGCVLCGESEPACLDAHHINPATKEFSIYEVARRRYGIARLQSELTKCACVCANCHRKIHAGVVALQTAA